MNQSIYNLTGFFKREIEILDFKDNKLIYAIDQKDDHGNMCALECLDLKSYRIDSLQTLKGTRIYECFNTYPALPEFFYSNRVDDDYTIWMDRISKKDWQIKASFSLKAEGEILAIYPINEDYILVTDEVSATDEVLEEMDDPYFPGKYYILTYLYSLKDGKKYYLNPSMKGMTLVEVKISDADQTMIYMVLQKAEDRNQYLYSITFDSMLHELENGLSLSWKKLTNDSSRIHTFADEKGMIAFHIVNLSGDHIHTFKTNHSQQLEETALISISEDDELIYDTESQAIYSKRYEDGKANIYELTQNPQKPVFLLSLEDEDEEFTGIANQDALVTIIYRMKTVKEDIVFEELTKVYDLKSGAVDLYEDTCRKAGGTLFLTKSYLLL